MKRSLTQSILYILPTLIGLGLFVVFVWLAWQLYSEKMPLLGQKSGENFQKVKFEENSIGAVDEPVFSAVPLFGDQVRTQKTVKKVSTKKEKLKIKLVGTLLSGKPIALIESEGQTNVYAVSDEIDKKTKLLNIGSSYITVDYAGKRHKVKMDEDEWTNGLGAVNSTPQQAASLPNSSLPEPTDPNTVSNASVSDGAVPDDLNLAVPIPLNQVFTSAAVQDNGEMVGFRVKPNKNSQYRQIFDVLKLQEGDLISQVNGISVMGYQSLNDLNVLLMNGSTIDLTIKRMGEEKTLKVQIP